MKTCTCTCMRGRDKGGRERGREGEREEGREGGREEESTHFKEC